MKKIIPLVFMFSIFFIFSCKRNAVIKEDIKTINIDITKKVNTYKLDNLLDTISPQIIILDTNNNSIIGEMEKFIISDNNIYILDYGRKSINRYNSNGKCINRIAHVGKARNEYISIDDFYISDDIIYVLDNMTMKIMEYDKSGQYIKTINLSKFWANGIFVKDKYIYLINHSSETDNGKYRVFKIDNNGTLVDKYLKFTNDFGYSQNYNVYTKNGNLFNLCLCPINVIYSIDSITCKPHYNVNFVNKNLPPKYYSYDLLEMIKKKITKKYILGVERMQETAKYLFIHFRYRDDILIAIYDKITNEVVLSKFLSESSYYKISSANYYFDDGYVYGVTRADMFKIIAKMQLKDSLRENKYTKELRKACKQINDDNSYVIIKYKLRD